MIKKLLSWLKTKKQSTKLESWFIVSWDDEYIYRYVSPPGQNSWKDQFRWSDIERICFETKDYLYSDDIYFFTSDRPESYVIPIEAKGGSELWSLILEKKLFDSEYALKALTSENGFFCWPSSES